MIRTRTTTVVGNDFEIEHEDDSDEYELRSVWSHKDTVLVMTYNEAIEVMELIAEMLSYNVESR